mmetsp:Transcript_1332/g.2149  ORF Transcript_1332/g.2149 Transcript_1332/m.2149 type:complete len:680 (+) Transcript_1332:428-2467(+)
MFSFSISFFLFEPSEEELSSSSSSSSSTSSGSTKKRNYTKMAQALRLHPNQPFCWNAKRWDAILSSGLFRNVFRVTPERTSSSSSSSSQEESNDNDSNDSSSSTVCLHIIAEKSPSHTLEYGISKSIYTGGWEGELDFQSKHLLADHCADDVLCISLKRGAHDPEPSFKVRYKDDKFGLGGGYDVELFNDFIGVTKRRKASSVSSSSSSSGVWRQRGNHVKRRLFSRGTTAEDVEYQQLRSSTTASPKEEEKENEYHEEEEEEVYGPGEDLLVRKGLSIKIRDPFTSFVSTSDVTAVLERTSTRTGESETLCSSTLGFGPIVRRSDDDDDDDDEERDTVMRVGGEEDGAARVSLMGSVTLGGRLFDGDDEQQEVMTPPVLTGGTATDATREHIIDDDEEDGGNSGGMGITRPYVTGMVTSRQIFPLFQDDGKEEENNSGSKHDARHPLLAFRQTLRFSTPDLPRHEANAMGFATRVRGYHQATSFSSSSSSSSSLNRNWFSLLSLPLSSSSSGNASKCRPISSCLGGTAELRIPVSLPSLPFVQEQESTASKLMKPNDASVIFFADWILASPWRSSSSSSSVNLSPINSGANVGGMVGSGSTAGAGGGNRSGAQGGGGNTHADDNDILPGGVNIRPFQRSSVGIGLRKTIRGIPIKYDVCITRDGRVGAFFGLGKDFDV